VLASSREPLGVDGEDVVAVPSLALPAAMEAGDGQGVVGPEQLALVARSEAVRLFVDRATATLPSFGLDRSNVRAVIEICRRLDGIPLALELAAARVNVLSADEIAQGLGDRFRLLTGGRRTAAPRQQTLQAAIDWSWELLTEPDRRLLGRLAVFSGGWTLDAAAAVTRDQTATDGAALASAVDGSARLEALDGLSRLVDRSLVVVDREGTTRYRMLETIRQYAAERLAASGETVALRDRHLALFRQLALDAEGGLEGPGMVAWLVRLDTEIDNLRAALEWAFETDPEAALQVCVAMSPYWRARLIGSEGLDRMLEAVSLARRWRTAAATSPGAERSVIAARVIARAALVRASYTGRRAPPSLEEEATAIARESGDPAAIADTLVTLTFSHVAVDGSIPPDGPEGETAQEALELAERLGDWYRISIIEAAFAMHEAPVDLTSAEGWLDRATEAARRSANPFAIGNVFAIRGRVASRAGRLSEAERAGPCAAAGWSDRSGRGGVSPDDPGVAAERQSRGSRKPARVLWVPRPGPRRRRSGGAPVRGGRGYPRGRRGPDDRARRRGVRRRDQPIAGGARRGNPRVRVDRGTPNGGGRSRGIRALRIDRATKSAATP
jgi:predicted ATPase